MLKNEDYQMREKKPKEEKKEKKEEPVRVLTAEGWKRLLKKEKKEK